MLEPVSILVLLDEPLGSDLLRGLSALLAVSILVLLDDASRRRCATDHASVLGKFQSLFSWMMPLGRWEERYRDPCSNQFQSLFSWMMPLGSDLRAAYRPLLAVSILVLLDDALGVGVPLTTPVSLASFNPCSPG